MVIHIHGRRFELCHPINVALVPQLAQRLAESSEDAAPAGDRSTQATNPAVHAIARTA